MMESPRWLKVVEHYNAAKISSEVRNIQSEQKQFIAAVKLATNSTGFEYGYVLDICGEHEKGRRAINRYMKGATK